MPTHITPILPRFGELDPYNHVNHAVYLSYFEYARCVALEEIGMALPDLSERDVQIIVTQLEMQFKAPATARDVLRIETEVADIRRASSRWHQRVVRVPAGAGCRWPMLLPTKSPRARFSSAESSPRRCATTRANRAAHRQT